MKRHPPKASLVHRERSFDLAPDSTFFIGRDPDCDLYIPRDEVSRRHAVVYPVTEGFEIFDFKSSGGVSVNGLPVKRFILKDGDRITVGGESVVFRQETPPSRDAKVDSGGPSGGGTALDRRLSDFAIAVGKSLGVPDLPSRVAGLFEAVFVACGQGLGIYWRVEEGEGFAVEWTGGTPGKGERGRSPATYQPFLEKLLKMRKVIFSGGTPMAPRSWGAEHEHASHFAVIPVPCGDDVNGVLLIQWEPGEITAEIEEVPLYLSMASRFATIALREGAPEIG